MSYILCRRRSDSILRGRNRECWVTGEAFCKIVRKPDEKGSKRLRTGAERHDVRCFFFRKDRPIPLCFCRQDQLPVGGIQHLRARVPQLYRHAGRVMNRCQSIRSERMAQTVVRPAREFRSLTDTSKLASCACRNHAACHSAVGLEPCCEIWLYRNDSSPCALCLCRLYLDVSAREIDFVPVQALNLSLTQSGECAYGNHRKDIGVDALCRLQHGAQFIDAENLGRAVNEFWFCGA